MDIVLGDYSIVVTTMFLLMEKAKLVIEPAGATSLTHLLSKSNDTDDYYIHISINDKKKNVVILLSGENINNCISIYAL